MLISKENVCLLQSKLIRRKCVLYSQNMAPERGNEMMRDNSRDRFFRFPWIT